MSASFGKGLMVSAATAVLLPAAFMTVLAAANAAGAPERPTATIRTVSIETKAPRKHTSLGSLGAANAVAWIGGGHVSASP